MDICYCKNYSQGSKKNIYCLYLTVNEGKINDNLLGSRNGICVMFSKPSHIFKDTRWLFNKNTVGVQIVFC